MVDRTSKIQAAERLMARPQGATMNEILAATGGSYQYNARRRLEARGFTVRTRKEGRLTRYWAEPPRSRIFEATVTSKGQVTVPQEIRERLGVRAGAELQFILESNDRVIVTPGELSVRRLKGVLGKPPRRLTLKDMDQVIRRAVAAKNRRKSR